MIRLVKDQLNDAEEPHSSKALIEEARNSVPYRHIDAFP
jgi:hypothetical protein